MKITALLRPTISHRRRHSKLFTALRLALFLVPTVLLTLVCLEHLRLRVISEGSASTLDRLQRQSAKMRAEIDKFRVSPEEGQRLVARGQALATALADPPVTVSTAMNRLERAVPGPIVLDRLRLLVEGGALRVELTGRAPGEAELRMCAGALQETAGLSVVLRRWVRSRDGVSISFNADGEVKP